MTASLTKQETAEHLLSAWCHHLRQDMKELFIKDMNTFIDALPKALIDESEKLPTFQQQPYLDIISLLRSNKQQLQPSIANSYKLILDEFITFCQDKEKKMHGNDTLYNLSLIDTEEIEVGILVEGQAGKVSAKILDTMNDAYLRISQFLPQLKTSNQLPCHPKALIQSMIEAFSILSLSTEHKIILAKLFGDFISVKDLKKIIEKSLTTSNIPEFDTKQIRKSAPTPRRKVTTPENTDENHSREEHSSNAQHDTGGQQGYGQQRANSNSTAQYGVNQSSKRPQVGGDDFQNPPAEDAHSLPQSHSSTAMQAQAFDDDLLGATSTRFNSAPLSSFDYGSHASGNQSSHSSNNTSQAVNTAQAVNAEVHTSEQSAVNSNQINQASNSQGANQIDKGSQQNHAATVANNAVRSAELLNQLGHLKALRSAMKRAPISPKPLHPLVAEEKLSGKAVDDILINLQKLESTASVSEDDSIQTVQDVREKIREQLSSDEDSVQTIDDKESDIINLISMMFDYILDNPNLSTEIKALLARLQIPMLRVALMTPDFISNTEHPSRKLLDKLAEAGISLDKSSRKDKYFDKLESFVFRVIKEFETDQSIFAKLYDELVEFLAEDKTNAEEIEKRTLEKEQKKAESQLAKSEVQKQLNSRLIGKKIPFCVVRLIQNGWWQVLYHTNIRYGIDSDRWENALKIVDALLWSVTPPHGSTSDDEDYKSWLIQLINIKDKLIKNLEVGLSHINFDPLQQSQLIRDIKQIHTDLFAEQDINSITIMASSKNHSLDEQFQFESADDEAQQEITLPLDAVTVSIKEQQEQEASTEGDSELLSQMIMNVRKMKSGDWVEFDADTNEPKRRKLVAKVRTLNKLVFTNRRGIKVAEVTNTNLAQMLTDGKAKLINSDGHAVDSALGSVFENVSKLENRTQGAMAVVS